MKIIFDPKGNLENDVELSVSDFMKHFGITEQRLLLIKNLVAATVKLREIGCSTMYVFGSFATAKKIPNDIDVCFDASEIDEMLIMNRHAYLPDRYERARIKKYFSVHIMFKDADDEIFKFLRRDRDGNTRGIIKISLKDLHGYDKE